MPNAGLNVARSGLLIFLFLSSAMLSSQACAQAAQGNGPPPFVGDLLNKCRSVSPTPDCLDARKQAIGRLKRADRQELLQTFREIGQDSTPAIRRHVWTLVDELATPPAIDAMLDFTIAADGSAKQAFLVQLQNSLHGKLSASHARKILDIYVSGEPRQSYSAETLIRLLDSEPYLAPLAEAFNNATPQQQARLYISVTKIDTEAAFSAALTMLADLEFSQGRAEAANLTRHFLRFTDESILVPALASKESNNGIEKLASYTALTNHVGSEMLPEYEALRAQLAGDEEFQPVLPFADYLIDLVRQR